MGHGGPKRARSRKRWKEAKGSLPLTESPLLGALPPDHNVKLVDEEKRYEESHQWSMAFAFDEGEILKALRLPPQRNDKLAGRQQKDHEP